MNEADPAQIAPPSQRRHQWWRSWKTAILATAVAISGVLIAIASVVPFSSETARAKVIAVLSDRLQGEVELQQLHVRVLPQLRAEGNGLTIRHKGRRDVPPLISIKHFSAEGNVQGLLRRRLARLTIEGLDIEIHKHSPVRAAPSAQEVGQSLPADSPYHGRPLRHLVLTFARPIRGPLIIGAGRFRGLGLCLPLDDGAAS